MADSWQKMTRSEGRRIMEQLGISDIDAALNLLSWDGETEPAKGGRQHMSFDDFLKQARTAAAEYRNAVAQVNQNRLLSAEGQRAQIAKLEATYRGQVDDVQARFSAWLAKATKDNAAALVAERGAEVQRLRGILGDSILVDLWRADVAAADDGELGPMLENAAEGFEREVMLQVIGRETRRRLNSGKPSAGVFMAQDVLRSLAPTSPAAEQARELEQAARRADELDLIAWANDTAPRLGVGADGFLAQMLEPAG